MATKVDKNIEKNVEKKDLANYFTEAKSWESAKTRELEESLKKAWWVAIGAGAIAAIAVITVAVLGPQKTAVPYVVRVDNATGAVDIVTALKDGETNYDEAMNKYNVQWYVRWREGYSKYLVEEYYKNVGIMSSPEEQGKYSRYMSKNNPNSPIKIFGDSPIKLLVNIKSTSFLKKNVAYVRFTKGIEGGNSNMLTHWAATITFEYAGLPMAESDRAVNPLGFQVVEYRVDPDQEITDNSLPSANLMLRPAPVSPNLPANQSVPAIR